MKNKILYGRQYIDNHDIKIVSEALKSNFITTGSFVNSFEKKLQKKLNSKFAITCSNATSGLHLVFKAIGLKKDDIILMPSINFISSYSMASQMGAKIFLVDVDPFYGQISKSKILECVKFNKIKKIKAIVSMPLGGLVQEKKELFEIKKKLKCYLIEDACHAIGAKYKVKEKIYKIGSCSHADFSIFSFHPVKSVTTGEGGAITTNSIFFNKKIREIRNHGIIKKKNYWNYDIANLSYNYRLSDINCALGISQLNKLDTFLKKRKQIFKIYLKELAELNKYIKVVNNKNEYNGYHLTLLNIDFSKLKKTKNGFFKFLNKKNIFPQYHYIPLYKFSFYKKKYLAKDFSGSENYFRNTISLPIYFTLTSKQLMYTIKNIKAFINLYKK